MRPGPRVPSCSRARVEQRTAPPVLAERRDHREHHLQRVLGGHPQDRAQLRRAAARAREPEPDAAAPEERVRLGPPAAGGSGLSAPASSVRTISGRPSSARAISRSAATCSSSSGRLAVEEQELGAQQPDALGALLARRRDVLGAADVGEDLDPAAVPRRAPARCARCARQPRRRLALGAAPLGVARRARRRGRRRRCPRRRRARAACPPGRPAARPRARPRRGSRARGRGSRVRGRRRRGRWRSATSSGSSAAVSAGRELGRDDDARARHGGRRARLRPRARRRPGGRHAATSSAQLAQVRVVEAAVLGRDRLGGRRARRARRWRPARRSRGGQARAARRRRGRARWASKIAACPRPRGRRRRRGSRGSPPATRSSARSSASHSAVGVARRLRRELGRGRSEVASGPERDAGRTRQPGAARRPAPASARAPVGVGDRRPDGDTSSSKSARRQCASAASASPACGPLAATSDLVALAHAERRDRVEAAPAARGRAPLVTFVTATSASKPPAVWTKRAAGRACRPSGFRTISVSVRPPSPAAASTGAAGLTVRPGASPSASRAPRPRRRPPRATRRAWPSPLRRPHPRRAAPRTSTTRSRRSAGEQVQRHLGAQHGAAEIHQHENPVALVRSLDRLETRVASVPSAGSGRRSRRPARSAPRRPSPRQLGDALGERRAVRHDDEPDHG